MRAAGCGLPGATLVADDRDHGKAWVVQEDELALALLHAVLNDPAGRLRRDLQPSDVLAYLVGQALAVLPAWMRGPIGRNLRPPHAFLR